MHYERPTSLKDATSLLAEAQGKSFVLAGGTDLLVYMKDDNFEADLVVDIKSVEGLDEIRESADGFTIGAAVPCAALGEDANLKASWPGVVEAANLIGSTQIQGRCTVVGNLCNASPAADSVPALVAAGAEVNSQSSYGCTPLHVAALNDDLEVGRILLEHGADPTLQFNGNPVRPRSDEFRKLLEEYDEGR